MMIATFGAFALQDLPEALAVMVFYKIGEILKNMPLVELIPRSPIL